MSSQTNKKPTSMNISPQNIRGTCNYKCAFSFDYPTSSCTATNYGNTILLSCTDSTSPVIFNKNKYSVWGCYLYSPSLHLYNNVQADAELCIMHTPTEGGEWLYVCIPISTNGSSNNASNTISEIVQSVANGAPSQGENVSQGIADFTLNDFIPLKEFYNYSQNGVDFVVFGSQNAIYISQTDLNSLQKVIKPVTGVTFSSGPELFLNADGPTKGTGATSDDIYIDCQPTNTSEEEINEVVGFKANVNHDFGATLYEIIFNPIFLLFAFALVFVILIVMIHKGLVVLSGGNGVSTE